MKSKKIKHGTASIIYTVVFIALLAVINVIFSALAQRYSLFVDMTDAGLWTLSEPTKEIVSDIDGDIKIIFCHEADYINSNESLRYIYNTAKQFDEAFDNISVENINIILEPQKVSQYRYTETTAINTTDIIVTAGGEFRVYSPDAFFVVDSDGETVWAYNGEEIFTAAFLAVTAAETPVAYFTTAHGESVDPEFINTLVKAGYDVKTIDLTKEDISPDARIIIINNPLFDFQGSVLGNLEVTSEIKKIDEFLAGYGTLMVFKDPQTKKLPTLEEYLEEWGVVFGRERVKDFNNSITNDGMTLVAQYTTAGTIASSLHKSISGLTSPPKTIIKDACPIYVSGYYVGGTDDSGNSTNTYIYSGGTAYRELSAVFSASGDAKLYSDNEVTNSDGNYKLMTITREIKTVNNDTFTSYVMAAGSVNFTASEYLQSDTYANKDIIYYALRMMGREKVPCDIEFKVYANTDIENMTTQQSNVWTVLLISVVPFVMLVTGAVVSIRRKYR